MDKRHMYSVINEIIDKYLDSQVEKDDLPSQLNFKITPVDVIESEDELLIESFFTIFHINECGCDASEEEFLYLRDCLNGKLKFNKQKRDNIIQRSTK